MDLTLQGIQVAQPVEIETAQGPLRTAMRKSAVSGPIALGPRALEGDGCADLKHHGHEDQAVCVMPLEHYPFWWEVLDLEEDQFPLGSFGDNFTIVGALETDVFAGDRWRIGTAEVEVTKPRAPCSTLNKVWGRSDFAAIMGRENITGWYLRVLKPGVVEAGQEIEVLHRAVDGTTIADMWTAKRGKGKASS